MERNFGNDIMRKETLGDHFHEVRDKFYPDGAPGYEEVGDTAYITFDEFTQIPRDADYYKNPPTEADTSDTVGLMLYSYAQITREGSPIKNVVMDLSCNTGGESSAAVFVIATFLGEGTYSIRNDITGALMTENYRIDLNLDHKFDEKDSLTGYKLYCLDSPASFSCGNLIPNVYKNSGKITILGQTSAGGSCIKKRTRKDSNEPEIFGLKVSCGRFFLCQNQGNIVQYFQIELLQIIERGDLLR